MFVFFLRSRSIDVVYQLELITVLHLNFVSSGSRRGFQRVRNTGLREDHSFER